MIALLRGSVTDSGKTEPSEGRIGAPSTWSNKGTEHALRVVMTLSKTRRALGDSCSLVAIFRIVIRLSICCDHLRGTGAGANGTASDLNRRGHFTSIRGPADPMCVVKSKSNAHSGRLSSLLSTRAPYPHQASVPSRSSVSTVPSPKTQTR